MRKTLTILFMAMLAAPCVSARERGHHGHGSKKFWEQVAVLSSASLADGLTTNSLIRRGGFEHDPIFGTAQPSLPRMIGIGMPIEFSLAALNAKINHTHSWMPIIGGASAHALLAYRNTTLDPLPETPASRGPITFGGLSSIHFVNRK